MIGLGTIVNTAAVVAGGFVGLFLKKNINASLQDSMIKTLGLSTMFLGISGALTGLLSISGGGLQTQGSMLMILSLIIGTVIGEALKIEDRLDSLGEKVKKALKMEKEGGFVEGFVTNTLVICVGAMAVVGSLEDGLTGNYTTLFVKSILDCVVSVIFASTLGVGVLFAAVPLFVYQGSITLLAKVVAPILSDALIHNISYIGSVLIFTIGVNMVFGKKFKSGNMIPALFGPVVFEGALWLINTVR